MLAQEQIAILHADPRLSLAVEVELQHVVGRRGRPDPVDDSRALQVRQHEPAGLLADERVLSAEAVVVAAGPVVAGDGRDLDGLPEHRQTIQAVQLLNPGNEIIRGQTLDGGEQHQ